ncbi:MAG: PQQ-dependent sugar dehydrogenase [Bacteroidota bacterium]
MRKFFLVLTTIISFNSFSQSEYDSIKAVVQQFITGTVYNYPDTILAAFLPGTKMFLYSPENPSLEMTVEEYAALYGRRSPGTVNNRPSSIVSIEQVLDVAYARVEVLIPFYGNRYNDLLLLKKFPDGWKIVAKCTSAEPIPKTTEKTIARPTKETVLNNLKKPWSMAFISETDVLIAEKDGGLLRVNLDSKERAKIKGLPKDVAKPVRIDTTKFKKGVFPSRLHGQIRSFNAGWFQVLLDPDFQSNGYIYLSYAAENRKRESGLKVVRGKLEAIELTNVEVLFDAVPYTHGLFHYGGGMIFGPDKKLYITTGERNFQEYLNPEPPVAQALRDGRGKVIRINPDGSIPNDNPDFGSKAIKGLYATGIRASQGLTIDAETKEIWFSEHGTIQGDELNILYAGANYGWPYQTSGRYRSNDYQPLVPENVEFTDPVYFWDQTVTPTGLTFYYGKEFSQWNGNILVPGLSKGSLWRMVIEDNKVTSAEKLFVDEPVRLRKAVVSPQGKLYLLTDEENGRLIRVVNQNY